MKKIIIQSKNLLVLLVLIFSLSSCCSKKDCYYGEEFFYSIQLNNFTLSDIDTVTVVRYEMNSGFISPLDSTFYYNTYMYGNSASIYLNDGMTYKYDYIVRTQYKSFKISDYLFQRYICNSCFLNSKNNDYTYGLKSYKIDGKVIESSMLTIENY